MVPQIGNGSAGLDGERVEVTTVLGRRDGPVGTSWSTALATPSMGHSPFVVVAKSNLPVVPIALFVPAVGIGSDDHARLTHGAAQAGVAAAVLGLQMDDPDGELCLLVSVWVQPDASDEDLVFAAARDATTAALKMGAAGGPWQGHLHEVETPENEQFRRP